MPAHREPSEQRKQETPAQSPSPAVRSQPAQWRFQSGSTVPRNSISVKSDAERAARKVQPLANWVRWPSPAPPDAALPGIRQEEFSKFQ